MKRYTASKARAQLSSLLDAAEDVEVVAIERPGVRFSLRSDKRAPIITLDVTTGGH